MFKKNLYSFCALIALSCNAYAMLEGDELPSSTKGRSALRASTASLGIEDQEPGETEGSASSPASSVPNSLFSNDEKNVAVALLTLRQAGGYGNPNPDLRANALYSFLQETFCRQQLDWDSEVVYELPLKQKELDGNLWDLCQDQGRIRKIGKAIGAFPTTEKLVGKLSAALGQPSQDFSDSKEGRRKLKELALRVADELKASREKISSTEAEYDSFRAIRLEELAAKEAAEKQLSTQLAERKAELEESKAQTLVKAAIEVELTAHLAAREAELEESKAQTLAKLAVAEELTAKLATSEALLEALKIVNQSTVDDLTASLEKERAQNQRFQSAIAVISENVAALAKII